MITLIIIIITSLLSYNGFRNKLFLERWMFNATKIATGREYYRMLTSGFVHKDMMHLLFNMFTLYFLGSGVERYFIGSFDNGAILYIAFYLLGIIISDIPSLIKHKNHEYYYSLGASGGVSSLVFCFILIKPLVPLCLFGLLCLPGFVLGALYMIYSIQMSKKSSDNINHDAHLYGAIFGILFMLIVQPEVFPDFIEQLKSYRLFD